MSPAEIAQLIVGDDKDFPAAREAIVGAPGGIADSCILTLDVLGVLIFDGLPPGPSRMRLRRVLSGALS